MTESIESATNTPVETSKDTCQTLNLNHYYNDVTVVSPEHGHYQEGNNSNQIPESYVQSIHAGFGRGADLYQDVLEIPRDASDAVIRIAYFRRGREILAQGNYFNHFTDSSFSSQDIPGHIKTRFQAVGMAYEILSYPAWKREYLKAGLASSSSSTTTTTSPKLGVRFKDEVEELTYECACKKFKSTQGHYKRKRNRNRTRNRRKVVEDSHPSANLNEHLQTLNHRIAKDGRLPPWNAFMYDLNKALNGLFKLTFDSTTTAISDDGESKTDETRYSTQSDWTEEESFDRLEERNNPSAVNFDLSNFRSNPHPKGPQQQQHQQSDENNSTNGFLAFLYNYTNAVLSESQRTATIFLNLETVLGPLYIMDGEVDHMLHTLNSAGKEIEKAPTFDGF